MDGSTESSCRRCKSVRQFMSRDLIHGAHQLIYFHAFTLNVLTAHKSVARTLA